MIEIRHRHTREKLIRVDVDTLEGADLSGANLRGANLDGTNLRGANLSNTNLCNANLRYAGLSDANLTNTSFYYANLNQANVSGANFDSTDLSGATLTGVDANRADFNGAYLAQTDLTGARFRHTHLVNCGMLQHAVGLDKIVHLGPSSVDHRTLRACAGELPDAFLLGVGYTQPEIKGLRALYEDKEAQYMSCYLSHGECDEPFAARLRTDLLANNVSCWRYRFDMLTDKRWNSEMDETRKVHGNLVLVCSHESVIRANVVKEIIGAITRERETGAQKLFPVRVDDFILSNEVLTFADEMVEIGKWRVDWVRYVRANYIPNFRNWREHGQYQPEFQLLLREMRNPAKR